MSCNENGVPRLGGDRINQFALVIYMPDPLARFLDDLRCELVAGCMPRAHMTVLPPRQVTDVDAAIRQAQTQAREFAPFRLEAGEVEVFPRTNVIYIGVRHGAAELLAMHAALNTGALAYDEPFAYHPHFTLAQDFNPVDLPRLEALARERWKAWRGPRAFDAQSVAFVQNTVTKCWIDLAAFTLGAVRV